MQGNPHSQKRSEMVSRDPTGGGVKRDWAGGHLAASPRVELRVVEDAGLLQHGALLDAEERRVVLCSSNQPSKQSVSQPQW